MTAKQHACFTAFQLAGITKRIGGALNIAGIYDDEKAALAAQYADIEPLSKKYQPEQTKAEEPKSS